jgi:tetratricopeptide (TPR) repeat protein
MQDKVKVLDDFQQTQSIIRELLTTQHQEIYPFSPEDLEKITTEMSLHQIWQNLHRYLKILEKERQANNLLHLGIHLYQNSLFQYAAKDFKRAISLQPGLMQAHIFLGNSYKEMGQWEEALNAYNEGIQIDNTHPGLYENRAEVYAEQQEYPKAIADFQKALSLDEQANSCHGSLGMIYMIQQQYQKALDEFNQLVAKVDNFPLAYIDRGKAYMGLQQYSQAVSDFEKALEFDLEDPAEAQNCLVEAKKHL